MAKIFIEYRGDGRINYTYILGQIRSAFGGAFVNYGTSIYAYGTLTDVKAWIRRNFRGVIKDFYFLRLD